MSECLPAGDDRIAIFGTGPENQGLHIVSRLSYKQEIDISSVLDLDRLFFTQVKSAVLWIRIRISSWVA